MFSPTLAALFLLYFIMEVISSNYVVVLGRMNQRPKFVPAVSAGFGAAVPGTGISGTLVDTGGDGCSERSIRSSNVIVPDAQNLTSIASFVAIIPRGNCSFEQKIRNAQTVGYGSAIVYDNTYTWNNDTSYSSEPDNVAQFSGLMQMMASSSDEYLLPPVLIPSVFVSYQSGILLKDIVSFHSRKLKSPGVFIYTLDESKLLTFRPVRGSPVGSMDLLLSEIIVIGTIGLIISGCCGVLTLVAILVSRYTMMRDRSRKEKASRLSDSEVATIKLRTVELQEDIESGENVRMCAICIDTFKPGQKIRELPCGHAFHQECVDAWLTQQQRSCPTCRADALSGK